MMIMTREFGGVVVKWAAQLILPFVLGFILLDPSLSG